MNEKKHALSADPPENDVQIRCPRLGHEIYFNYCRLENNGLPCFKTLDCWFTHFDVHAHLKADMSEADFEKVFLNIARPKIHALFELIQQARDKEGKPD